MRGRICGFLICIVAAGWAFSASSQVSRTQKVTTQVGNSVQAARLPYMAEFKTTQMRRLPDGTAIENETIEVVAVDSQGRRMTATTNIPPQGDQTPKTRFTVFDPTAHTKIEWMSPGKEVAVSAIPIPAAVQCSWMSSSVIVMKLDRHGKMIPNTKTTQQDLGTGTIHGVEARGRRTTTTTPAKPIKKIQTQVSTFEVWTAIDPGFGGLVVRQVNDDPPSGKTTKELVKFSQAEPDSAIFRIPSGYDILNREVAMDNCPGAEEMEPAAALPR